MQSHSHNAALETVEGIVAAAAEKNITRAALCRAAEPPLHEAQITRWLAGQEPRRRQIERLRLAFLTLTKKAKSK